MILYITYVENVIRRTERFVGQNNVSVVKDVLEINVEFLRAARAVTCDESTELIDLTESAHYETVTTPECVPGDTVYVPIVRYTANDGAQVGRWCLATPRAFLKRDAAELALKCALNATYFLNVRPWEGMYERFESANIVGVVVS